jgi:Asp-tRNA(Asn)/Glu-tRNA(Gln) amidotransferase A subunit family amidase
MQKVRPLVLHDRQRHLGGTGSLARRRLPGSPTGCQIDTISSRTTDPCPRARVSWHVVTELPSRSVTDLAGLLSSGELTALELATACLDAIAAREDELRAWVHIDRDQVLARARELDAVPAADRGPLHGIPVGVKDIIDTADLPTEYGSPIYAGHRPATDAEVVTRLRAAGAVIVGKTVTTEFALFQAGPTANPHDPTRTPGGSSSGSAAAVGAGTLPLALGTQTAGSVIRPASFCGIVGVKPTFGAIPTTGVKQCSPSLDTVGVFARDVDGAEVALQVLTGGLPAAAQRSAPDAIRIGFARTPEWEMMPAATRTLIENAVRRLSTRLDVSEVDLPEQFVGLVEAQICVMYVEVSRSLAAERAEHADLLSAHLRGVLAAGDRSTWAYQAAQAKVERCRTLLDTVFEPVDVLLAPSVLGEPPPLDEGTGDPLLCRAWTALGTPAVSLPGLTGPNGLPVGVQVIAPRGRDGLALAAAAQVAELLPEPPARRPTPADIPPATG